MPSDQANKSPQGQGRGEDTHRSAVEPPADKWFLLEWEFNDNPSTITIWVDGQVVPNKIAGQDVTVVPLVWPKPKPNDTTPVDSKTSNLVGGFQEWGFWQFASGRCLLPRRTSITTISRRVSTSRIGPCEIGFLAGHHEAGIMKATLTALLVSLAPMAAQPQPARDYPVRPVPFTAVHVSDQFWAPKIETNRKVTIPFAFGKDEETGRIDNFIRAAKALRGEPFENHKYPPYPFDDTDVYKVIEGASYTLSVHPDKQLEAYVDDLIAKIGAAQEPDGYLYTARTIDPKNPHPWSGPERWSLEGVNSHELYDLGHLYEAAVAYYDATGKRSLLDIALRTADLLDKTFGLGKREIWPGHQIIEMGLAKLYRTSNDPRYLNLAKFMLDSRGPQSSERGAGNRYVEAHEKVTEQTEAVAGGHAVRAMYMYSGMADVAALTGDEAYVSALDKIWENVAYKKLHVTGGVGARAAGEAFGDNYELPNMSAYNETCAAVGNDYWNHRLFLLHADAKYIDVMERTLYNGLISGVSLDGKTFFYQNPLEATGNAGKDQRSPWFGVACCPGNITRFMASVPGYVYGQKSDSVWVNLFMASSADIKLDNGRTLKIVQETRYPWDGAVKMTVTPDQTAAATLNIRIPGWAHDEPVPSDLYRFADKTTQAPTLRVNGHELFRSNSTRGMRRWPAPGPKATLWN